MDTVDESSNADLGRHDTASDAPSASRTPLQLRIEKQRAQLLQAHGVLRCLYEVLLHAECRDAVFYADAASVVADLISNTVEELDSVRVSQAEA